MQVILNPLLIFSKYFVRVTMDAELNPGTPGVRQEYTLYGTPVYSRHYPRILERGKKPENPQKTYSDM